MIVELFPALWKAKVLRNMHTLAWTIQYAGHIHVLDRFITFL